VKPDEHWRMVRILVQRSGVEGKEKRGLLDELLGTNWCDGRTFIR
jgi:hypothetical protein